MLSVLPGDHIVLVAAKKWFKIRNMKFRRNDEYFYQKLLRPWKKGKRPQRGRDRGWKPLI